MALLSIQHLSCSAWTKTVLDILVSFKCAAILLNGVKRVLKISSSRHRQDNLPFLFSERTNLSTVIFKKLNLYYIKHLLQPLAWEGSQLHHCAPDGSFEYSTSELLSMDQNCTRYPCILQMCSYLTKWCEESLEDIFIPVGTCCNHWPRKGASYITVPQMALLSIQHLSCSAWTKTVLDIAQRRCHSNIPNKIQVK
ncbi:hypothetical protein BD770DRAFT_412839 [Pilaira anomala]|nr:hypothetical protein BD770DRAFT_412839 [Pilaira anomala]